MESNSSPQRTPLYPDHLALGGRMVAFAGWELPVRYAEIIEEHRCVREKVGLFDVSHMGEIFFTGPQAAEALNGMLCNDVRTLSPGKAQYSAIPNHSGGLVDDVIVYMHAPDRYMLCVNASNTTKDFDWFCRENRWKAQIENRSASFGQLALQGPNALDLMRTVCAGFERRGLERFHFMETDVAGIKVLLARTGYTGEDGFEIFVAWDETPALWRALLEKGKPFGIMPIGLGARDSLRLEACYPLYGHELREDVSAVESGLKWIVKLEKGEFIGRGGIEAHIRAGAPRSLTAFVVEDPGIVREGALLYDAAGVRIGEVTSGMKLPTVDKSAGMALVRSADAKPGSEFFAEVRGRRLRCRAVKRPLYSGLKSAA